MNRVSNSTSAGRCGVSLLLALALLAPAPGIQAQSLNTPWRNLTLAQLSAVWWQWTMSIPVSASPLFDDTGVKAYAAQPHSDLLFLGGTFNVTNTQTGDVLGQVTRSITIQRGVSLFFPLLNSAWDNVCNRPSLGGNCAAVAPFPANLSVPELRVITTALTETVSALNSTLTPTDATFTTPTGPVQNLDKPRLQSPPFVYRLPSVPGDLNLYQFFGIDVSGTVAPAAGDGYYSFVPASSLQPGYYLLSFGGSQIVDQSGHTFTQDITYRITVN